jgi:Ca-activated chloride channel family protein
MLRAGCAMLLVVVLASGQQLQEQVITVNVDLVNIYFSVCNKKGRMITNLDRGSFRAFEDGKAQTITHFSKETDAPLTILLLIDTSGSVRDKLKFEQQAAVEFLAATLRRGRDKAAVFTFDHVIEMRQDFTDDPLVLAGTIKAIVAGGGTRMYDALYSVISNKLSGPDERKVVILVTDGDDKSSRRTPDEVVEVALRNDVSIYSISVNALGFFRTGTEQSDGMLDRLALETGGMSFFPKKVEKLAGDFKKIGDELRSQYTLAYRSTNQKRDGMFRRIEIEANKTYSVRARPGYFAPVQVAGTK